MVQTKVMSVPRFVCCVPNRLSCVILNFQQVKPHKCSSCPKSFSTPGDLRNHTHKHTENWPFRCPICNKGFSKQMCLNNHVFLHTGEFLFIFSKSQEKRPDCISNLLVVELSYFCQAKRQNIMQNGGTCFNPNSHRTFSYHQTASTIKELAS